mgnify:FL=1
MKKPYFTPAIKVITLSSERLLATSSVPSQNEASLESEIAQLKGDLKKQKSEAQKLKKRIKQLEETVVVVQKEHQQFQADQMPYKRIPKQVKVNKQTGTKECPECKTENPMEANYCKHCHFCFWDYKAYDASEDRDGAEKPLSEVS